MNLGLPAKCFTLFNRATSSISDSASRRFIAAFLLLTIVAAAPIHALASKGKDSRGEQENLRPQITQDEVRSLAKFSDKVTPALVTKVKSAKSRAESNARTERAAYKSARGKFISTSTAEVRIEKLKKLNDSLRRNLDAELSKLTPVERSAVISAEPNFIYDEDAYIPNDADLNAQWDVRAILAQRPTLFDSTATLARPVVVAVIDAGVDYNHQDLAGNMWCSAVCVDALGNSIAGGCTNGYDFLSTDVDPFPTEGSSHGTAVASLIAASTDNGKGIASISQNRVRIMSLRVSDGSGIGLDALVPAVYFAANNNADIINMSLSGPTYSQTLADAIAYAESRGVTVVASAGNYGSNNDSVHMYPASYSNANVIAVGATGKDGVRTAFSNYGDSVDVWAPGSGIRVAQSGNAYGTMSGTSFSAPIISAYIARGLSEGVGATQTIAGIPNKVLGAKIADAGTADINPFVRMPDGKLFNTLAKGGEYVLDALGLNCTVNCNGDTTIGFATQISPGSTNATNPPTITTLTPTLSWNAVSGAGSYGVYLTNHTTGANVLFQDVRSASLGTSVTAPTLVAGNVYRWNTAVRKTTTASAKENLTPVWYFRAGTSAPLAPPAVAPTGIVGASTVSPGVTTSSGGSWSVSWSPVNGANFYLINYGDVTGGGTGMSTQTNSATFSSLGNGKSYKFNVQACNNVGCGPYSLDYYFNTPQGVNTAPTVTVSGSANASAGMLYGFSYTTFDTDSSLLHSFNWDAVSAPNNFVESFNGVPASRTGGHVYTVAGNYCIKVRVSDGVNAPVTSSCLNVNVGSGFPDVRVNSVIPGAATAAPGASVPVTVVVSNAGLSAAPPSTLGLYFASDASGNSLNTKLADVPVSSVAVSGTQTVSTTVTLPAASTGAYPSSGSYRIIAVADSTNVVNEGTNGESNNNSYALVTVNAPSANGSSISLSTLSGSVPINTSLPVTVITSGIPVGTRVSLSSSGVVSPAYFDVAGASTPVNLKFALPGTHSVKLSTSNGYSAELGSYTVTSSGIAPFQNKITVILKDTSGSPLAQVPLTFTCVGVIGSTCPALGGTLGTGMTDSLGKVTLTLPDNKLYIIGVIGEFLVGGTKYVGNVTVTSSAQKEFTINFDYDVTHAPVVLVPGIMGSSYGDKLIPYLPGGDLDISKLKIADAEGSMNPVTGTITCRAEEEACEMGWEQIRKALESQGYVRKKTIIDCPYDWRLSDEISARTYLRNCINNALASNPHTTKVDIIAHSQGGLVTRALLQSQVSDTGGIDYSTKVRKIAFIGSPMNGATEAYMAWFGGEAKESRALILAKTFESSGIDLRVPTKQLPNLTHTSTNILCTLSGESISSIDAVSITNQKMRAVSSKSSRIYSSCGGVSDTSYSLPGNGLGITYSSAAIANPYITRAFIRANATSVKQLLPTYKFLIDPGIDDPKLLSTTQNEFLTDLNGGSCFDGVCNDQDTTRGTTAPYNFRSWQSIRPNMGTYDVAFFYGNEPANTAQFNPTVVNIVKKTSTKAGLWEEGEPVDKSSNGYQPGYGDGTVPTISVEGFINDPTAGFTKANKVGYIGEFSDHAHLMRMSVKDLVPFLSGVPLSSVTLNAEVVKAPELNIRVTGNVVARVVKGAQSAGIGADSVGTNTFTGAEVNVEGGMSTFSIPNPADGAWSVVVSGALPATAKFYIDYSNSTRGEPHEFTINHRAGVSDTYSFTLNSLASASSSAFMFAQGSAAPSNVKVTKSGANSAVAWTAPTNTQVSYYTLYVKLPSDLMWTPLASTTATSFTTSIPFAAASTTLLREFSVSAMVSGQESFMTLPIANDDTDQDGINDVTEVGAGFNVAVADTDGDGMTDGQEYFVYNTNALSADTDGNGVGDLAQTIASLTVNRPPIAVADSANAVTGVPVTISVLTNDSDADGSLATSSLAIVAQPQYGSAVVQGGSISYTSALGYVGTDSLTYSVVDNGGATSTAVVTVTVAPGGTTSYVSKSMTITASPGDGRVYIDDTGARSWTQIVTEQGIVPRMAVFPTASQGHAAQARGNPGPSYYISRMYFPFSTAILPDSARVTSAVLKVKQLAVYASSYAPMLMPAAPTSIQTLATSDYGKVSKVRANASVSSADASGFVSFPLNANGLAAVSATSSTSFALSSFNDVLGIAPTTTAFIGAEYAFSEYAGGAPVLAIQYDEPLGTVLDTVAPKVTLATQAPTSSLVGAWTLTATATDAVWLKQLSFVVDGKTIATSSGTSFTYILDTKQLVDGVHTLVAVARDASGNTATSSPLTFTSENTAALIYGIDANLGTSSPFVTFKTNKPVVAQIQFGTAADGTFVATGTAATSTVPYTLLYPLNGPATSTLKTSSNLANIVKLKISGMNNRTLSSVEGRNLDNDGAVLLDRSGDYVGTQTSVDAAKIATAQGQSISFWIKTSDMSQVSKFAYAHTSTGSTTDLFLDKGRIRIGDMQWQQYQVVTQPIADGLWHKVDLVFTNEPQLAVRCYVDGELSTTFRIPTTINYLFQPVSTWNFSNNPVTNDIAPYAVDELGFTAGPLTASDIKARFDTESISFGASLTSYASSTPQTSVATTSHRIAIPVTGSDVYHLRITVTDSRGATTSSSDFVARGPALGTRFVYATTSLVTDDMLSSTPFVYGVGDWATQRNNSVGVLNAPEPGLLSTGVGVYSGAPSAFMSRIYLAFDTRAVPTGAVVTGASLTLTPKYIANEHAADPKSYFAAFPSTHTATTTLSPSDWVRCGPALNGATPASEIFKAGWVSANVATSVPLTALGLATVNRGGFTTLCVREGHDIENIFPDVTYRSVPPPWSGNAIQPYGAELGAATAPTLSVSYTFGNPKSPPNISYPGGFNIVKPVIIQQYSTYSNDDVVAYDAEDGNITNRIRITGTVNTSVPADYIVSYEVTDSDGMRGYAERRVAVMSAPPAPYTSHFKFEGGVGGLSKRHDSIQGATKLLTEVGTPIAVPGRAGDSEGAYALGGEAQSSLSGLELATTTFEPGSQPFTASVWARTTGSGSLLAATNVGTRSYFNIGLNDVGLPFANMAWPGYELVAAGAIPTADNKWHKYDVVASNASTVAVMSLYVDGVRVATATGTTPYTTNYTTPGTVGMMKNWYSGLYESFRIIKARFDDVGFTTRALSNDEVLARYRAETFGMALTSLSDFELNGVDILDLYTRVAGSASTTPPLVLETEATSTPPVIIEPVTELTPLDLQPQPQDDAVIQ